MPKIKGSFQKIFASERVAVLIGRLDAFFIKLPHLPKPVRLFISKVIPFLALIFGIIGLLASIMSGFFLILALIAMDFTVIGEILSGFVLVLLDTLFLLKAFKPLRQGNAVGWIYLFWAEVLEIVNFAIRSFNGETNIWLGVGTILLSFYLLFEIGQFYVYKKTEDAQAVKPPVVKPVLIDKHEV